MLLAPLTMQLLAAVQVFPSLNHSRREDVVLLQSWLRDTMGQLTTEFRDRDTSSPQA